jgi:molybdopterin molybdotransferase
MIPVEEALARVLALCPAAAGRTVPLARPRAACWPNPCRAPARDQPPFAASAMDGYAVAPTTPKPGAPLAGDRRGRRRRAFDGPVGPGRGGAHLHRRAAARGADRVVIQEDVTRDGDLDHPERASTPPPTSAPPAAISRRATRSRPRAACARSIWRCWRDERAEVTVTRRPEVALIATGDELVMPGEDPAPRPDRRLEHLRAEGDGRGRGRRGAACCPSPATTPRASARRARPGRGADVIVTIGGASVGDHDLVGPVSPRARAGARLLQDRHAARQAADGGPALGAALLLGLPGNPVSAIVCAHLFLLPALRAMQGLPARARAALEARGWLRPVGAERPARALHARPARPRAARPDHPVRPAGQRAAVGAGRGRRAADPPDPRPRPPRGHTRALPAALTVDFERVDTKRERP